MATEKKTSRWVDAISSMIELTQDGKLLWSVKGTANTPYDKERTTSVFETKYKDRALRLYQIRVPSNIGGGMLTIAYTIQGVEPPKWFTKVILEFIDSEGRALWTFPEVDALSDLLTSVQYQVAGVKDFLDTIISEARGAPKALATRARDVQPEYRKRGQALDAIIQIVDDGNLSESERLKKAKAAAVDALLTSEF
ncbi:MAG TPA: hypothetical protein VNO50_03120 [Pyrinomonadaceae bacterium]|nr:hypothetical protein [Pyrinomonadaceae bacterium]